MSFASAVQAKETEQPKPKPPLTAYNLYFQVERKRILNGTDGSGAPITVEEISAIRKEHKLKGKRLHRKTHGKITFRDLARTIAARWKNLDNKNRCLLEQQAVLEKQDCAKEYRAWLAQQASAEAEEEEQQVYQAPTAPGAPAPPMLAILQRLRDQLEAELARLSPAKSPNAFAIPDSNHQQRRQQRQAPCVNMAAGAALIGGLFHMNPENNQPPAADYHPLRRSNSQVSLMPLDWETGYDRDDILDASIQQQTPTVVQNPVVVDAAVPMPMAGSPAAFGEHGQVSRGYRHGRSPILTTAAAQEHTMGHDHNGWNQMMVGGAPVMPRVDVLSRDASMIKANSSTQPCYGKKNGMQDNHDHHRQQQQHGAFNLHGCSVDTTRDLLMNQFRQLLNMNSSGSGTTRLANSGAAADSCTAFDTPDGAVLRGANDITDIFSVWD